MRRFSWLTIAYLLCFSAARADDSALAPWRDADARTRAYVLSLARRAFDTYAQRRDVIEPPADLPPILRRRAGVFVSTMRCGAPRCCMGTLYPTEPNAAREIIANAVAAAGRDRRFPPIRSSELKGLTLIVSIVGTPHPTSQGELAGLDPARYGLVVKQGQKLAVMLPGEAKTMETMLSWGKKRAGVAPDAQVELFRLDAVRWMEGKEDPAGAINDSRP